MNDDKKKGDQTRSKKYSRSVGELVRSEDEVIFISTDDNEFTTYQIGPMKTLTVIESWFDGMVGETIVAHSYHTTEYDPKGKVKIVPIRTLEEFKALYKEMRGKKLRVKLWYYVKNFNGWSEDPIPYVK